MRENLALMRDLTERMEHITDLLRTFASKGSTRPEPVSVQRCVGQAVSLLAGRIEPEGVELIQKLPDREIRIRADEVGLGQVLINLIRNALDAIRGAPLKRVILRLDYDRERAIVSVEDSGPGIRDEHLTRVFEPFFSTKQVGEGLGLGLALAYGLIESFGGTIEGSNSPRGGAVFTLRFPRIDGDGQ